MSDGKIIQENGENIMPITYETCVLDDEGNPITETIGDVSLLNTESGNLVGAINEVFGDTIKEHVVDALLNKGSEITVNDSWVNIIDEINKLEVGGNKGLDIISATELPAIGRENQICVITDNPVDKFIVTGDFNDITDTGAIYMYTAATDSNNLINGSLVSITSGSITHNYHIIKFCKENLYSTLDSYIYLNGNWEQLTFSKTYFIDNKTMVNTEFFGGIKEAPVSNFRWVYTEGKGLTSSIVGQSSSCIMASINNPIDFSKYSTVEVTGYITDTDSQSFGIEKLDEPIVSSGTYVSTISNRKNFSTTLTTYTYDISSWSGTGYLTLYWYTYSYTDSIAHEIFITDFSIY